MSIFNWNMVLNIPLSASLVFRREIFEMENVVRVPVSVRCVSG